MIAAFRSSGVKDDNMAVVRSIEVSVRKGWLHEKV